jgi:hypothetical protein
VAAHPRDDLGHRSVGEPVSRIGAFVRRTARAVKIVVGHGGIPRPIRWLAAVGLLPVPGPFDEALLLLVALVLFVFYRSQLREAWERGGVSNWAG